MMALGLIICTQKLSFVELEYCHNNCEKLLWIKNIQESLPIDCDFGFVCLLLPEIFSKIINVTGNNFSIFSYGIIFLVQLWTVNNYHWYLKQQLEFPASLKDRVACFTWDPEVSLRMHLMTKGKSYIKSIY